MTRDWTEAQARAWLRASLPKGWQVVTGDSFVGGYWAEAVRGPYTISTLTIRDTYRSACRALVRAAKRAGIAVNQVQEPGGKS